MNKSTRNVVGSTTNSATERLRALLDEQGVERTEPADEYWELLGGMPTRNYVTIIGEKCVEEALDGTLAVYHLTPEQAIAATLGRGTCHETVIDHYWRGCGSCGYIWEFMYGIGKCERPRYCPNCGRKVVE